MFPVALYNDRSVMKPQVQRTRDLMSTTSIHSSLPTALAMECEAKQAGGGFILVSFSEVYCSFFSSHINCLLGHAHHEVNPVCPRISGFGSSYPRSG